MTNAEQRAAAKQFYLDWDGKGDEKQDAQRFWLALLQRVLGVEEPDKFIEFEVRVKLDHTSFIDAYIDTTKVLIEQKGINIDLHKSYKQSDGSFLTPYQQARRYAGYLPHSKNPRWIVVSNFELFEIHDMNKPNDEPLVLHLNELEKQYHLLNFIVEEGNSELKKEMEVSLRAGEMVGELYDALHKQYAEPDSLESQQSLNKLCVRLVFCLYAEDAGLFDKHGMFHDYLSGFTAQQMRKALVELFKVLNQTDKERDPYLKDDNPMLAAFPYVNGGLFADEDVEIPPFTEEIKNLLLEKASAEFNWSDISPTIFGAVFESTLNPETRRSGGMHYTSIENIHKVIDPLFMEELGEELDEIRELTVLKKRNDKLKAFQQKLSELTFLDPACGSGNFLTETYLSLRKLENEVLMLLLGDQIVMGFDEITPIKVSISQFYGIEINDFAVTVAKTAMWIAESQMMKRTEDIVHMNLDFLPLKSNVTIVEGNALRLDWNDIVPKEKLNYIMGNPPFVGYSLQNKEQKSDILSIYVDEKGKAYKTAGKIDYVAGWYFKAAELMQNTLIHTAFVSTNSITQGEQVAGVWKPLYERFNIHIDFAHRTFRWDSEASIKAHVHCVIVGFSQFINESQKKLFTSDRLQLVDNINAYLIEAPTIFIENRKKPICNVPRVVKGSSPVDGGNLLIEHEDYDKFNDAEKKYIKRFYGAREFLHNIPRWCLWLEGVTPSELKSMPMIMERISKTRDFRLSSPKVATQKYAEYPMRFMEVRQPETEYILIPRHSSENRRYIPFGFLEKTEICGDANIMIPQATIYNFGVLISNVHMAWTRTVCGRIKSDYRYSNDVVYNNFPWPEVTEKQKKKIEQTAQAILDARALYPDSSLADLYDEVTMPPELRRAHQQNDKAVMEAYGFKKKDENGKTTWLSESETVAELMKIYQKLVNED